MEAMEEKGTWQSEICINMTNQSNCFNGTFGHDDLKIEARQYFIVVVFLLSLFGLVIITGLIGNLLVIIVVIGNRHMRSTTNLLILNLAIADFLFLSTSVGLGLLTIIFDTNAAVCKVTFYFISMTAALSIYTLVLLSLDRYFTVVHPVRFLSVRTRRNTLIVIAILWVVICSCCIPAPLHIGIYCMYQPEASIPVSLCYFTFGYLLPLVSIMVLYGFILKAFRSGQVRTSYEMRTNRQVTCMVFAVILAFAICWGPYHCMNIIAAFSAFPDDQTLTVGTLSMVSLILVYINSCINPILYAFLSPTFRQNFARLLCCCCKKQRATMDENETTVAQELQSVFPMNSVQK